MTTTTEPDTSTLGDFEGIDVVAAKIEIPDAAGGLRDAMSVEPVVLHHGDEGYIVLHYRTKKVRFDPKEPSKKDPSEGVIRVHVFETLDASFISAADVEEHARTNRDRVAKLVEERAGVMRLGDELDDIDDAEHAAELVKAHGLGLHPHVAVVGCVSCDERESDRSGDGRERADLS